MSYIYFEKIENSVPGSKLLVSGNSSMTATEMLKKHRDAKNFSHEKVTFLLNGIPTDDVDNQQILSDNGIRETSFEYRPSSRMEYNLIEKLVSSFFYSGHIGRREDIFEEYNHQTHCGVKFNYYERGEIIKVISQHLERKEIYGSLYYNSELRLMFIETMILLYSSIGFRYVKIPVECRVN